MCTQRTSNVNNKCWMVTAKSVCDNVAISTERVCMCERERVCVRMDERTLDVWVLCKSISTPSNQWSTGARSFDCDVFNHWCPSSLWPSCCSQSAWVPEHIHAAYSVSCCIMLPILWTVRHFACIVNVIEEFKILLNVAYLITLNFCIDVSLNPIQINKQEYYSYI